MRGLLLLLRLPRGGGRVTTLAPTLRRSSQEPSGSPETRTHLASRLLASRAPIDRQRYARCGEWSREASEVAVLDGRVHLARKDDLHESGVDEATQELGVVAARGGRSGRGCDVRNGRARVGVDVLDGFALLVGDLHFLLRSSVC